MTIFAGLDVHSKQCTYAIQDASGKLLAKGELPTTLVGIADWVTRHSLDKETTIGMETGLITPFVARTLKGCGIESVQIINAAEVRAKARRKTQKSDTGDAFEICDGTRRDIYASIVELPDAQTQKLRDQLATRRHFVTAATREVNGIKSALRKAGLGHLYRSLNSDKAFVKLLAQPQLGDELKASIQAHQRLWTAARKEVKCIEKQLEQLQSAMAPEVERLQTVPGVGPIVALTALAYFSRPVRFKNAKHAASYTGLVPQMYNSADRECYGHITKQGPNELRAMLCEAAQHAARKGNPLHLLYKKIRNKKGHKVAVIAVAHRLARILWSMMRKETTFDSARYSVVDPKWQQLMQDDVVAVEADANVVVH
jgi:transposase